MATDPTREQAILDFLSMLTGMAILWLMTTVSATIALWSLPR